MRTNDLDPDGVWGDPKPIHVTPLKTTVRIVGIVFLIAFAALNIVFRGHLGGPAVVHVLLGAGLPLLAAGAVVRIMVFEYLALRRSQGPATE